MKMAIEKQRNKLVILLTNEEIMSVLIQRRSFLIGLGSLFAAPAIIKAESLMKVGNIDHILYPVRGIVDYCIGTDQLLVRLDRANFPINMTPKVMHLLSDKEINALFTKKQIASIMPTKPLQQLGISKAFNSIEWSEKGLLSKDHYLA